MELFVLAALYMIAKELERISKIIEGSKYSPDNPNYELKRKGKK